jgi:parallel beta-helix repeat protein
MSLDGHAGFRVTDSTSRANGGNGILVWDADDTVVEGNEVDRNAEGVVVRGAAQRVRVTANTVTRSAGAGIAVRDGAAAVAVTDNTVSGSATGVQVRDAVAVVRGNRVDGARAHGLSFQGAAGGSAAERNSLAGAGPSGLDLFRLDADAAVAVSDNLVQDWQVVRPGPLRLRDVLDGNPLLWLWTLLFLLPVAATRLVRRRPRDRPYPWAQPPRPVGATEGPWPGSPPDGPPDPQAPRTRVTVVEAR